MSSIPASARRAAADRRCAGVKIAGKTGTAQVRRISAAERRSGVKRNEALPWKQRDHALFVAFAPTDAPRYAVSVIIEHGIAGGRYAAPIARDVLTYPFRAGARPEGAGADRGQDARRTRGPRTAEALEATPRRRRRHRNDAILAAHRQHRSCRPPMKSAIPPPPVEPREDLMFNGPWLRELARLPWGIVLVIVALGGFGIVILYSAAGGSLSPWALKQAVRFTILLTSCWRLPWCARKPGCGWPGRSMALFCWVLSAWN